MAPPEYVQKTIKILERVISSPKMDPKLLARPPIKFQRDIFEAITKNTGFMKGLFNKKDIDNEALKSRDKKRDMFTKVVTLLEIMTKKDLGIDADKILAGQESEKTNLMLQLVGRLASKADAGTSSDKYVKATMKKLAAASNSGTALEENLEKESGSAEKESDATLSRPEAAHAQKPKRERGRKENEPAKRANKTAASPEKEEKLAALKPLEKRKDRSTSRPTGKSSSTARDQQRNKAVTEKRSGSKTKVGGNTPREASLEKNGEAGAAKSSTQRSLKKRPPSANANRRRPVQNIEREQADNDEVEIDEEDDEGLGNDESGELDQSNAGRPMTSRGSRPTTARNLNDQFLVQTKLVDDDNDDNYNSGVMGDQLIINGAHGLLVDNMLKVRDKEELDDDNGGIDGIGGAGAGTATKSVKFTTQQMKEFERRRQELIETQKKIEEMSKAIQPLAKAADYAQEDADQMSKEHQSWRQQVAFAEKNLKHIYNKTVVKSNNNNINKIKQLEAEVEQKKAQIRSQIYQNILLEEKLDKLTEAIVS